MHSSSGPPSTPGSVNGMHSSTVFQCNSLQKYFKFSFFFLSLCAQKEMIFKIQEICTCTLRVHIVFQTCLTSSYTHCDCRVKQSKNKSCALNLDYIMQNHVSVCADLWSLATLPSFNGFMLALKSPFYSSSSTLFRVFYHQSTEHNERLLVIALLYYCSQRSLQLIP